MVENPDVKHLVAAAVHHVWKQERRAHADWYWNMTPSTRSSYAALTDAPEKRPWRACMDPDLLHLTNILEEMGHYDGSDLTIPANFA